MNAWVATELPSAAETKRSTCSASRQVSAATYQRYADEEWTPAPDVRILRPEELSLRYSALSTDP